MNAGPESSIEPAIRPAPVFPETKPLDDLLRELQRQRSTMGIVADEYGRTVGIVTVEDVLEEVVGEIEDETDPHAESIRRLTDGDWYVRGHVSLGDLEDAGIELPVETDAFNSIGGYVFSKLGRLPKRGDTVRADGYSIRVESVRENRIVAVRMSPPSGDLSGAVFLPSEAAPSFPRNPGDVRRPAVWVVRLTDKQLEVLRALLRSEEHLGPALQRALEALELARWDDLPDAQLPWSDVTAAARRQGVSEADVVWDLCGCREEPTAKKPKKSRKATKAGARKSSA